MGCFGALSSHEDAKIGRPGSAWRRGGRIPRGGASRSEIGRGRRVPVQPGDDVGSIAGVRHPRKNHTGALDLHHRLAQVAIQTLRRPDSPERRHGRCIAIVSFGRRHRTADDAPEVRSDGVRRSFRDRVAGTAGTKEAFAVHGRCRGQTFFDRVLARGHAAGENEHGERTGQDTPDGPDTSCIGPGRSDRNASTPVNPHQPTLARRRRNAPKGSTHPVFTTPGSRHPERDPVHRVVEISLGIPVDGMGLHHPALSVARAHTS